MARTEAGPIDTATRRQAHAFARHTWAHHRPAEITHLHDRDTLSCHPPAEITHLRDRDTFCCHPPTEITHLRSFGPEAAAGSTP